MEDCARPYFVTLTDIDAADLSGLPWPRGKRRASACAIKSVWRVLLKHANADSECWPKYRTIAAAVGCCVRTVRMAIDALVRWGFVSKTAQTRERDGSQTSNRYRILRGRLTALIARRQGARGGGTGRHPLNHPFEPKASKPTEQATTNTPEVCSRVGMDGMADRKAPPKITERSVREMLWGLGVRGKNLETLVSSSITTQQVAREWSSVVSDPKVRCRPAVLVRRLGQVVGATFVGICRTVSAETTATVLQLENLRRQRQQVAVTR